MNDYTETIWRAGDERVSITPDNDPMSPRDADNLGTIAGPSRPIWDEGPVARHIGQNLKDYGYEETVDLLVREYGTAVVVPLRESRGPSGATSLVPTDDGERADAIMFDTAKVREAFGTPEHLVRDAMLAELDEFNRFLDGDVWIIIREERVTWVREDDPTTIRTEWEMIDSFGGLIGRDYAVETALGEYPEPAVV